MRICFIFRDSNKGGKSIEGIFNAIVSELSYNSTFEILTFEYDISRSILYNVYCINKIKADIFHITGDVNWITPFLFNKKVINTIHDIGTYYILFGLKKYVYKILWINLPIFFSNKVTVVSTFTKNEILKIYNTNKLQIIPNPVNPIFKYKQLNFSENYPTILLIGTASHKNIEIVIKAVVGLKINLNIIGKLSQSQTNLLEHNNIKYTNKFNLSLYQIYNSYINSDMVVFASLHEGFGMPIIESNAVGRPLILSNRSPMPMIANGSALLFDPQNIEELKNKINTIINNKNIREELIKKGLTNAKNYDIKLIANQYSLLYKNLYVS